MTLCYYHLEFHAAGCAHDLHELASNRRDVKQRQHIVDMSQVLCSALLKKGMLGCLLAGSRVHCSCKMQDLISMHDP